MNPDEVAEVKAELEGFVEDVFASLPRSDQRSKGSLYLRGLMLDGRRKSMQPMGERLGVDYQQLQQFVSASPWKVEPVRRRMAGLAVETIQPEAWVIDDTGFKKDGTSSPCVSRQYSGTLGKIGNCQIGVSVHAATDAASCPLDWRLFVPEAWDDTCAESNDGSLPEEWLLAEWPTGEKEPTDYWISDLPEATPIATLVRIAKMRWRIEHDYRELKTGLGLAHFEGRTFNGWHRHATLVTAAHLFLTRLRLTHPKAAGAA